MTPKSYKGKYYMPMAVDFAMLEKLPPEGQMLGFHPIAVTVPSLTKELNATVPREGWVSPNQVTGRLVSLHKAGMVVQVKLMAGRNLKIHPEGKPTDEKIPRSSSSGIGWQRTAKGERLYEEHTGKSLVPASDASTSSGGGQ